MKAETLNTVTKVKQSTSSRHVNSSPVGQQGMLIIGKVVAISDAGNPVVSYNAPTEHHPVEALSTVMLDTADIGKDIALSFAQNRQNMPIVMGVIRSLLDDVLSADAPVDAKDEPESVDSFPDPVSPEVLVNGQKLELSAAEEVTLRCGKSSITLKKNGKIVIRGEHILSRAAGANRIKGGSIELN
ncbi:hypothetical protein OLMES_4845 [Oleiphilus messinensis]|uniref:DUF6484 domain-containing protein n=1 Tax=Oleiphilus messinensis TaxID=141451 RepID=A0A1Y0IHF3_9GAMM|nr:DUF6484 domain-containing protein [Oleiphilus messinensis]ARU58833.1 hypothetical protein OLMES_4845 [Oleiphilus messinensis]